MADASTLFSDEVRERVAEAVKSAEGRTAAEIVCAAATESGRYDRAEGICGLLGAVALLALTNFYSVSDFSSAVASGDGVSQGWAAPASLGLFEQMLAICLGYVAGNLLASYVHPLRRLLVSEREMDEEVARSASRVFLTQRMSATRGAGGVLVFVSLFERRVLVLADDGVMEHDGQALVEATRDRAQDALRSREYGDAFVAAVDEVAGRLEQALPIVSDDTDELPNELRVFHPRP